MTRDTQGYHRDEPPRSARPAPRRRAHHLRPGRGDGKDRRGDRQGSARGRGLPPGVPGSGPGPRPRDLRSARATRAHPATRAAPRAATLVEAPVAAEEDDDVEGPRACANTPGAWPITINLGRGRRWTDSAYHHRPPRRERANGLPVPTIVQSRRRHRPDVRGLVDPVPPARPAGATVHRDPQ
jgi:hypothetical protein